MTAEIILTNAILVLPEEAIPGTLVIRDGRIAEIQPGRSHAASARDLEGDHLIPGVVDVHTDNLERQVQPRQNARVLPRRIPAQGRRPQGQAVRCPPWPKSRTAVRAPACLPVRYAADDAEGARP